MGTTKIRLWFVRETEKAYQYTKLPPDRQRNPDDLVWIPKSQIEHRSKQPNGLHEVTLPDWLVEAKNLLLVLSLILFTSCSTSSKKLNLPQLPKTPQARFGPAFEFKAAAVKEWTVLWKYNTADTNAYWWDLQESTNLTTWITIRTNLPSGTTTVMATNKYRFYRLKGHK